MPDTPPPSRSRFWPAVALVVAAYLGLSVLWLVFDNDVEPLEVGLQGRDEVPVVVLDVREVHPLRGTVDVGVTLVGGASIAEPDGSLREAVRVDVYPQVRRSEVVFAAGEVPGTVTVELSAAGDPHLWPFDTYTVDSLEVALEVGAGQREVAPQVLVGDSTSGWGVDSAVGAADGTGAADQGAVTMDRSNGTKVGGLLLCALLVAIAGLAVTVAVQTVRGRRPLYPPLMGWFAAVLFAVAPLRGLLPGGPPMGAWVDRLVVLWVLIGVVGSMGAYVRCWWKAG